MTLDALAPSSGKVSGKRYIVFEMDLFSCISMTNNVNLYKKIMEGLKLSDLVFSQGDVWSS